MFRLNAIKTTKTGIGSFHSLRNVLKPSIFHKSPRFNNSLNYGSRRSLSYNYNHPYRPSGFRRSLATMTTLSAALGLLYYLYWPTHTFPSSVAKILRKGLWAESDKGEYDYQLALKHYIEALHECKHLGMDPLDDEYTGIQLKIAEMYERLNMLDNANFVYNEIASLYLKVLTEDKKLSIEKKHHFIQKDLRIAIKLVELNKMNPTLSKAILFTHSIIATTEIEAQLGVPLASVNETSQPEATFTLPFMDEYINLINLLIAINISLGDLSISTDLNIKLNKLMIISKSDPKKILLSQCNLGSLLYLQSEQFELGLHKLAKKYDDDLGSVDYKTMKTETFTEPDQRTFKTSLSSRDKCIQLAMESYEGVVKIANTLTHAPNSDIDSEQIDKINEIVALSIYSLGVINLHLRDFDKAERLLRESRVKSKSCNYDELISEIERELKKLFNEKSMKPN